MYTNYYDLKQLAEHKENLLNNIKRQEEFIEWLQSQAKTDDSGTLDRAIIQLENYQKELADLKE